MAYAILGTLQFELLAYSGAHWQFAAEYAEHTRIQGKPRLQWVGDKLEQSTLTLKFHHAYCDPEYALAALRAALSAHTVLPLVWANGKYQGDFILTELQVTLEQTDARGALQALEVTLSLKEAADGPGPEAALPLTQALAVYADNQPMVLAQKGLQHPPPGESLRALLGATVSQTDSALQQLNALWSLPQAVRSPVQFAALFSSLAQVAAQFVPLQGALAQRVAGTPALAVPAHTLAHQQALAQASQALDAWLASVAPTQAATLTPAAWATLRTLLESALTVCAESSAQLSARAAA